MGGVGWIGDGTWFVCVIMGTLDVRWVWGGWGVVDRGGDFEGIMRIGRGYDGWGMGIDGSGDGWRVE